MTQEPTEPTMTCLVKITHDDPNKSILWFYAPQEIAAKMKKFGQYLMFRPPRYEILVDPRYEYDAVKNYLLALKEQL